MRKDTNVTNCRWWAWGSTVSTFYQNISKKIAKPTHE